MFVNDEHSLLKSVVVGTGQNYDLGDVCNSTMIQNQILNKLPTQYEVHNELNGFQQFLIDHDVDVIIPKVLDCTPDQTCPRDIGFVIDHNFILSNTLVESRKTEFNGVKHLFNPLSLIKMPKHAYLEGGDLIVHGDHLFAGLGQRSNKEGIDFIKQQFPNKNVITIEHGCLHLDCCFNILSNSCGIYAPSVLKHSSIKHIEKLFPDLIHVKEQDQKELATNFLQFKPGHIVARDHSSFDSYNNLLEGKGCKVHRIQFDAVPKLGGSFRCATLPILRI